jgi:hypothetical protein
MWSFGYLVFVVAFGWGMHRAWHRSWQAAAGVAAAALPAAWLGLVLLVPFSRTRHFSPTTLLPDLGIAAYSVCVGWLAAWGLARFPALGRVAYVALFSLLHALLILVGGVLAVGLSKGS